MKQLMNRFLLVASCFGAFATGASAQSASQRIECDQVYVVQPGDTLSRISSRAYGADSLRALYDFNKETIGQNPNLILVGQRINIPCGLNEASARRALQADFSPAPQDEAASTIETTAQADATGDNLVLTFNRAAAPKFIMNVGIIDGYLAEITEVTEGRVSFVDPPKTDRDPRAQLDLVLSGKVDGAYVFNGHLSDSHPLLQLPMQPLMGGTAEQTAIAMWRLHETHMSQTDYLSGVHLLGFIGAPAAHIWRLKDSLVKPDENIQASNEYTVPYFDGLDTRGAAAVQEENAAWLSEFDEDQGLNLTMVMAHGAALAGGIWKEDNRSVTEIPNGVYTPTFSVVLSKAAWDRISLADQAAIAAISGEVLSSKSAAWDAFDNGLRSRMLGLGLDVVDADMALLAELQDQSRIGLESWIAEADASGLDGYQAVTDYMETLKELGAGE